ncbi:MAG TPA: bis-aminopropyl spermidine synthase family protein [Patescibacteria group bacterium]|nr:bis-aminopropyl spermidine synthase family protein [Patescibacteria group bacterium]
MGTSRKGRRENDHTIEAIARDMNLKEGEEAVRRILAEVHRRGKVGTKDLAKGARLPTPVAAAIRRELEKRGVLARKGGAVLTEKGREYVEGVLGFSKATEVDDGEASIRVQALSDDHLKVLDKLREFSKLRPMPSMLLDQAFATPETALKRTLYMMREGDLVGREVLFLGDDDFTSVASALLGVAQGITVLDVDERLLNTISDISVKEGLGLECVLHDLREPLPPNLKGRFDVVLTDPPYTVPGLRLFLSRAIEALKPRKTASIYAAFADKPPLEMLEVHREITGMGMFVRELIPRFNEYEGAEIFANTTSMMRLTTTEATKPAITGVFQGKMYTGEVRPTMRVYRCRCGERIEVGTGRGYTTVEELKARGCPSCGSHEGFRLQRRVRTG